MRSDRVVLPSTSFCQYLDLFHRTLQCYHLYQIATNGINESGYIDVMEYSDYRSEMIRLNETLLYAQREFSESMDQSAEDD